MTAPWTLQAAFSNYSGEEAGRAADVAAPEAEASGTSRREFASMLLAVGAAAAGAMFLPTPLLADEEETSDDSDDGPRYPPLPQFKWGMAIDLDLCTACGACAVACRTENNVPCAGPSEEAEGTGIYWMDILPSGNDLDPGAHANETLPLPCMHCEEPPCTKVCPVGATYRTDEGITAQIWDRCIGCRYCMVACPYSRRYFNWTKPDWPEEYRNFLNPDVATRPEGVVEKCVFCHHRIRNLKETSRLAGEQVTDEKLQRLTACAEACPASAITFGNLNDDESKVSRLHRNPRALRLLEHAGTKPNVVYLRRERREGEP